MALDGDREGARPEARDRQEGQDEAEAEDAGEDADEAEDGVKGWCPKQHHRNHDLANRQRVERMPLRVC